MKVFYIYAHPEPKSFNGALKITALAALQEEGHEVELSDLYGMDFDPVLKASDFPKRKNPKIFNAFLEGLNASKTGALALDIKEEMEKVKWADLLIFQFPIYFTAMPAIMKGWIDRVMVPGFAFNPPNNIYAAGLLKGKSALLVMTCGSSKQVYSKGGSHGDLNKLLESTTHCIFEFVGMKVLPSHIIYDASSMSKKTGAEELKKYRNRLLQLPNDVL